MIQLRSAALLALVVATGCRVPAVQTAPAPAPVTVGADRLFPEFAHLIRGKKLALVSNHSGRLADGTHLADALHRYPDAWLRVLFGMEFDIRSNDYSAPHDPAAAVDRGTGLVKHSLYGGRHEPTREMLGDAEVIVVDIQEVGARFYEHVNILGFVMEAAAENGHQRAAALLNGLGLRGVVFDPVTFTPEQKTYHGRPPDLAGEHVNGVHLRVTDRDAFEPYKAGVAMLWAVHQLHPDRLAWNDAVLERLTATRRLKAMIVGGRRPEEIFASWRTEVEAFRARSAPYRLYR